MAFLFGRDYQRTFPVGLFWCKNLKHINASSTVRCFKNNICWNSNILSNSIEDILLVSCLPIESFKKGLDLRVPVFDYCWSRINDGAIHVK